MERGTDVGNYDPPRETWFSLSFLSPWLFIAFPLHSQILYIGTGRRHRTRRRKALTLEARDSQPNQYQQPTYHRRRLPYRTPPIQFHSTPNRTNQAGNASLQRNKQRLHAARAQGDAHMASVSTVKMDAVRDRFVYMICVRGVPSPRQ